MTDKTTQVKFTLESDLVSAFKSRCASEGISMAAAIRHFMRAYRPVRDNSVKTLTRPQRRKAVAYTLEILNDVLSNEEEYRDAIPEHFTQRHDTADDTCEALTAAIERLEDAYE
jgi:hypothetical protein